MIIKRALQASIERFLFKGKVIVLYGARQVGKTTLVKEIIKDHPDTSLYLNCDEPDIRLSFSNKTSTELKSLIGNKRLVVIDEAQSVRDMAISLKLIADTFPDIQVIATGSSSFELASNLKEPLTGRKIEFTLYPFSIDELGALYSDIEIDRLLTKFLVYGLYPEIVLSADDPGTLLKNLAYSYSFKDIFKFHGIKNPEVLEKLLRALALQVGNEVSYNELASLIGIDKNTVANYIRILEQAFIIFKLPPLSRNLRNEIKKSKKIYFYDDGVRNALINNLNPIEIRQDVGGLWENFFIVERMKFLKNAGIDKNIYFWRTFQKQEIDYVEEENNLFHAFKIKWGKAKAKLPDIFSSTYQLKDFTVVHPKNYREYLKD
jgi:uncharacterized protein